MCSYTSPDPEGADNTGWISGKGSPPKSGWALKQASQGSGHSNELAKIQEASGQHSQT